MPQYRNKIEAAGYTIRDAAQFGDAVSYLIDTQEKRWITPDGVPEILTNRRPDGRDDVTMVLVPGE